MAERIGGKKTMAGMGKWKRLPCVQVVQWMGNNCSYDAIHSPDNDLFSEVKYQDMKEMRRMG